MTGLHTGIAASADGTVEGSAFQALVAEGLDNHPAAIKEIRSALDSLMSSTAVDELPVAVNTGKRIWHGSVTAPSTVVIWDDEFRVICSFRDRRIDVSVVVKKFDRELYRYALMDSSINAGVCTFSWLGSDNVLVVRRGSGTPVPLHTDWGRTSLRQLVLKDVGGNDASSDLERFAHEKAKQLPKEMRDSFVDPFMKRLADIEILKALLLAEARAVRQVDVTLGSR